MNPLLKAFDMRSLVLWAFAYIIFVLQQPSDTDGAIFIAQKRLKGVE